MCQLLESMDVDSTKRIQALVAQEIFIKEELQKRSEELKASLLSSKVLHRNDLLNFAIKKAAKAEEQLEIAREQIETLKGELRNADQELEFYHQELGSCNKEMLRLENEIWILTFNKQ